MLAFVHPVLQHSVHCTLKAGHPNVPHVLYFATLYTAG
jgi:hypothetical protein